MTLHIHIHIEPDTETRAAFGRIERALHIADQKDDIIMSQITDFAALQQTHFAAISTSLDGIIAGIKALDDKIVAFQNSPGTLSPEDQAALDSIETASAALVTKTAEIDTTAPAFGPAA